MVGVYHVKRRRAELKISQALIDALDAYRQTLVNPVSRNFIIAEALREYLSARGVEVHPHNSTDAQDA